MREAVALGVGAAVLLVGGVAAYAATRPPAAATPAAGGAAGTSSTSAGAAAPSSSNSSSSSASSSPANTPQGLVSSGKTSTGWTQTIAVQPNVSGLSYQGFFGDVLRVTLPSGCNWRQITGTGNQPALSPPSGNDDFVFVLVQPMTYELAYTDANRVDQTTSITLSLGGTFQKATSLSTGDYVLLALKATDLLAIGASLSTLTTSMAAALAQPVNAQQAMTVVTAENAYGPNVPTTEAITFLLTMGPWADQFAPDVHSFDAIDMSSALPSWWPTDDTAAASEYHVLYRYVGPGIAVSSLPIPALAWTRTL
jgi:hypothetical protein